MTIPPDRKDDWSTLDADLRSALQQQFAAYEELEQTQRDFQRLMQRARDLLAVQEAEDSRQSDPGSSSKPPSP